MFQHSIHRARLTAFLIMAALTACAPAASFLTATPASTPTVAETSAPTLTPTAPPQATSTPAPVILSVWWPEPLAPVDKSAAANMLAEQISSFEATQTDLTVDLRLKREGDLGGIMATLRAASPVAPAALPDLTLMRRGDMLAAVQDGLIFPLEGYVSSAVLGDLYEPALRLGQVGGELYGVPYLLTVEHMAYHHGTGDPLTWRFDDVLARGLPYAFPAGVQSGVSSVFFAQYLDAGGALGVDGLLEIDSRALYKVLNFYEKAAAAGIVSPTLLGYARPGDYRADLASGVIDAGVVTSTLYLDLTESGYNLSFGALPAESGEAVSTLDGWMWVLTTASASRQAQAARFLNWMMNTNRQSQYGEIVNMLPSQRGALQLWGEGAYTAFVRQLLANASPFLADNASTSAARALQGALAEVISGQRDAAAAVDAVLDQLAGQ